MHAKRSMDHPASRRRRATLTGLAALAGLWTLPARADILAFSTNVAPQLFGAGLVPVDLSTAAGAQNLLVFLTPTPDLVEITFSAECSVTGTVSQYGSIQIQVNPAGGGPVFVPIVPTLGPDDAFCSGNGIAGSLDGYVTASMTVVTQVPAGAHQVQVLANAVAGAPAFRLDDLSITVDN